MGTLTHLSLGTNLGNRLDNFRLALRLIQEKCGKIITLSKIYETPALGFESEDDFLNMCISVQTELDPRSLLNALQLIEIEMGRTSKSIDGAYVSRVIDLDIILYGKKIIKTKELVLPHPRYKERLFVLVPFNDILKKFKDPENQKSLTAIKKECSDTSIIRPYKESI